MEDINFIYRIIAPRRCRSEKLIGRFWSRHKDMRRHYYSRLNRPASEAVTNQPTLTSSTDIPLQCLDAQLLLATSNTIERNSNEMMAVNPSPASSSLDLEWEHECLLNQRHNVIQPWLALPEEVEVNFGQDLSSSSDGSAGSRNEDDDEEEEEEEEELIGNRKNASSTKASSETIQSKLLMSRQQRNSRGSWSHISTPDSMEWDVNCDDERPFDRSEDDLLDNETMELLQEIEWLKNRALNETGESIRDVALVMADADESES